MRETSISEIYNLPAKISLKALLFGKPTTCANNIHKTNNNKYNPNNQITFTLKSGPEITQNGLQKTNKNQTQVQGVSGSLSKCLNLFLRLESNLLAKTGDIFLKTLYLKPFMYYTGCFRFIVKMFELITQAKKQPLS